ncbi:MAG: bifunctional methylenetetrahydrofolate dehydrogenase/methenyltetrahydrofolate cyclohydrolase FolD [Oscillospiraceae bacterium]|nr:bifunctional methylenetetrahydrofolate dehydrogenase/methenyltetrahydrofolate cyclohydrolase FolD [Oscillospiraceae bacterium]
MTKLKEHVAKRIDGIAISNKIKKQLTLQILKLKNVGITPGLAVILVGENEASKIYVKNKNKACQEVGIYFKEYLLKENTKKEELCSLIEELNLNPKINGIIVQLPLPKHIFSRDIVEKINPIKDVDVLTNINIGRIMSEENDFLPCTPAGIIELLKHSNIDICSKHSVVIGRSIIVGKPTALLLLNNNSTVTICHSKTKNLKEICKKADIIISAVGKAGIITEDMVKNGAVIIDVGINRNSSGHITGDVLFDEVSKKASYITPVPGGVGPMTVTMLLKNTIYATKKMFLEN